MSEGAGGQRNRYRYGFTIVSAPPVEQRLQRTVNGVTLTYVRRGDAVRVYDGLRELPVNLEAQAQIVARWPANA